jgi:hypothetical protein
MKIEELRIGNWVNLFLGIDDEGAHYRPMQIKGVMEDLSGEFYYLSAVSNTWVYSTQNLEPIPLTEDILLKCGFRSISSVSYILNDVIIYSFSDVGICFKYNEKFMSIKYLHQLQNLYWCLVGK